MNINSTSFLSEMHKIILFILISTKIKFICESSEKKVNIKSNFLQVKRFLEFQWIQITPATAFPMNALALLTKSSICIMNWPGGWMAWFKLSWDLLA